MGAVKLQHAQIYTFTFKRKNKKYNQEGPPLYDSCHETENKYKVIMLNISYYNFSYILLILIYRYRAIYSIM